MKNSELISRLEGDLEKLLAPSGVEVVDVQYLSAHGNMVLRVFIDVPGKSVDLNTCERVSRQISSWLDDKDPIDGPYLLEVSSPGIDRILKKDRDFERFNGQKVKVQLKEKWNNKRNIIGMLAGYNENEILIDGEEQRMAIPRHIISKVRLMAEI